MVKNLNTPLVIINPVSGDRGAVSLWRDGCEAFPVTTVLSNVEGSDRDALTWPVLETTMHDKWLLRLEGVLKEGLRHVICVGGDGTISMVTQVLRHFPESSMFVVPSGRGNDFVRSLYGDVPVGGGFWSWVRLQKWREAAIDLLEINDRICLNVASLGYGGEVVEKVHKRGALWSDSGAVYVVEGALNYFQTPNVDVTIRSGQHKIYHGPLFAAFLGNGKSSGHGLYWFPQAKLNDGKLELLCFQKPPFTKFLSAMRALQVGNELPFAVNRQTASAVTFECAQEIALEIDGEYGGRATHYQAKILPQAVKFWTPGSFEKNKS